MGGVKANAEGSGGGPWEAGGSVGSQAGERREGPMRLGGELSSGIWASLGRAAVVFPSLAALERGSVSECGC